MKNLSALVYLEKRQEQIWRYTPAIYIYFDVHLDAVEVCTVGVFEVAAAQVHIVYRFAARVFYAHSAGGVLPACGVKMSR